MKSEYRYGLVNRPAGIGCIPNEVHALEPSLETEDGRNLSRHGVVVFERPLTEKEMCSFELSLIATEEVKEELAIEVALRLGRYAKAYLEEASDDAESFAFTVWDKLRDVRPYRVYVGDRDRFIGMVKCRLEAIVANQDRAKD